MGKMQPEPYASFSVATRGSSGGPSGVKTSRHWYAAGRPRTLIYADFIGHCPDDHVFWLEPIA